MSADLGNVGQDHRFQKSLHMGSYTTNFDQNVTKLMQLVLAAKPRLSPSDECLMKTLKLIFRQIGLAYLPIVGATVSRCVRYIYIYIYIYIYTHTSCFRYSFFKKNRFAIVHARGGEGPNSPKLTNSSSLT